MKLLGISFLIISLYAEARSVQEEQKTYFFKQRAVMLSQLQFEKNLDLMQLDPDSCEVPVEPAKRIATLQKNIKTLSDKGAFTHCPNVKFIGNRKVVKDLDEQKKSVIQIKTFDTKDKGVSEDLSPNELASHDHEASEMANEEIIEPEDNTILPESGTVLINEGTSPSNLPILSGYVGIPYASKARIDETFFYFSKRPYTEDLFRSRNLPPGLTFVNSQEGIIVGIPKKAGAYSPQIEVGHWVAFEAFTTVFRGPVRFNILPTPKFTVLDSVGRVDGINVKFSETNFPFLTVEFPDTDNSGNYAGADHYGVKSLAPLSSGKNYFEVKIHQIGKGKIGVASVNGNNYPEKNLSIDFNATLYTRLTSVLSDSSKLKKGDVLGFAIDVGANQWWVRLNGKWLRRTMGDNIPDPVKGIEPYGKSGDGMMEMQRGQKYWPFASGSKNTKLTFNFGDQPWDTMPPEGFKGIPHSIPQEKMNLPNTWDSNTASKYHMLRGVSLGIENGVESKLWGGRFDSKSFYTPNKGGDAVLAMSPKRSGRWQFEIEAVGYPERTRVGIAPSNFDTHSLIALGAKGTGSIGLRRRDEFVSQTGKGVIEVDGVKHEIDFYSDHTRFTFDCNFDTKNVNIYADGKHILETKLPENKRGEWVIAATSASGMVDLHTLPPNGVESSLGGHMKYPVAGVKPWVLDTAECADCAVARPVLSEVKQQTCAEARINHDGKIYSEAPSSESCILSQTLVGEISTCEIPEQQGTCELQNKFGGQYYICSFDPDAWDIVQPTEEGCRKYCKRKSVRQKKKCTERGWE